MSLAAACARIEPVLALVPCADGLLAVPVEADLAVDVEAGWQHGAPLQTEGCQRELDCDCEGRGCA